VQDALSLGDLANKISEVLDNVLNKIQEKNILNSKITDAISAGKNIILNIINNNLKNNFGAQMNSIENIDRFALNWNKNYLEQDFKNMDIHYKYIEEELKEIMPLEFVMGKVNKIGNLHNLIKNRGGDFNISKYELELASKLA
jgi:hypothetical protein